MPLAGLMSMWERKEQESDPVSQVTTLAGLDSENIGDYSWNEDEEYPGFRQYRQVLINSPAYAWLASTLTAELQHETLGENRRAEIHQRIANMLDSQKNTISRKEAPPAVVMRFHTSWHNMTEFFRYQDYGTRSQEALPRALVLTGTGNNIQCSTVTEYMSQVWPYYGPEILKLYQMVGPVKNCGPIHCKYLALSA